MIQTLDVDAARWRERRNVEFFSGEPLQFNILNRQSGAEIVLMIAADNQAGPVIEVTGTDQIVLTGDTLLAIPEGGSFVLNIWSRSVDGLSLLVEGKIRSLQSVAPATAYPPNPLSISGVPSTTAEVGTPYSFTPSASGGTPPYTFSIAAGALPAGLLFDTGTGVITGTPTGAESQAGIVLRVTDAADATADLAAFGITVLAAIMALAAPGNLFTPAQSAFDTTAHVDLRSNWQLNAGRLECLNASTNDARLSLDSSVVAGHAHFGLYDATVPAATVKYQLGGSGSVSGRGITEEWMSFEFFSAAQVANPYIRVQMKPASGFTGSVDNVQLYDLASVDPNLVACDVIIVGGDSNSANATSEKFGVDITSAARETPFDPRIWYMPHLRVGGSNSATVSQRHIPQPCIEPVSAVNAVRMSPVHAVAGQIVGWSAARGRPLLVMALGDPGSGLMNTEDWRKTSSTATTGSRMWNEMVAMKAALDALGPAHQIVGAVWSLGANDQFAGDYEINHGPAYSQFFADVRADIADVPMVLWNVGTHLNSAGDGRSDAMRQFLRRFDQDSGDARSIDRFKVVEIAPGNQLSDDQDPHYNAHGMQVNGRDGGSALLSLL